MSRRSDSSPQELQQRVLQTLEALLEQVPHGQLSLRQVARESGYTAGALIHGFGSWGLLLLRINALTLDALYEAIQGATAGSDDPSVALFRGAEAYHDFATRHRHRWRLVFEHKLGPDEPLPAWQQARIQRLFQLIEGRLRQLKPTASQGELEVATRVVWSGVHGITLLSVDEKLFSESDVGGRALIHSLLSHYLAGWSAGRAMHD